MRKLLRRLACALGLHDWTCKAREGIKPDANRVATDTVSYFYEYAKMYCRDCGKVSRF